MAVAFGASVLLPPLQAADMLAYEIHRQFRNGVPPPVERWQSIRLSEGGKVSIGFLDEAGINDWAAQADRLKNLPILRMTR